MKKINAIIERSDSGGISIYSDDVNGAYGFGLTEEQARAYFLSVLEEQAEYYKEVHGDYPSWKKEGYEVDYMYDISGFFEVFPFINASKFAKEIGINPSLMRKYKGNMVSASDKQRSVIQDKYDQIVGRMQAVRF